MRARIVAVVAGCGLVLAGSLGLVLAPHGGPGGEPVHFSVEEGAPLTAVASDLQAEGLVRNAWVLHAWARLRGQERSIRSGEYELPRGMSVADVLEALVSGPLLTRAVTLPEGWTRARTVRGLADGLELDAAVLDSLTRRPPLDWSTRLGLEPGMTLEGYLFPETYRFARGVSEESVLRTVATAFAAAFGDSLRARAEEIGMTVHEVVTLASIVEAEAVLDDERPAIAAVYRNRLRRGWKLEADPTVAYALDKIGERLTFRDLEVDSPYNTYRVGGLPPGPINSPGIASIRAVLWPDPSSEAMYFVADGQGGHRFSRTWEEHQAAVRDYRAVQRERRGGRSGGS